MYAKGLENPQKHKDKQAKQYGLAKGKASGGIVMKRLPKKMSDHSEGVLKYKVTQSDVAFYLFRPHVSTWTPGE